MKIIFKEFSVFLDVVPSLAILLLKIAFPTTVNLKTAEANSLYYLMESRTTEKHKKEPCPGVIIDDLGGAFGMGLVGDT